MKKSIAVISVLILVLSIAFTACSKKNVIYDDNGEKHIILTDKHGEFVQDEFGGLFEVVTDALGETQTKGFIFPDRVTNKRGNKLENSFIKLAIPRGWNNFSANNKLSIQHNGECLDMQEARCQVEIKWNVMSASDDLYKDYLGPARWLAESQFNIGDLKEYESEIFGLPARVISYRTDGSSGEGGTFYYYLVERGLAAFEIEFFANDRCFTEEEIKEAIEKAYVLKDLGGVRPTLPPTEASSEDSTAE